MATLYDMSGFLKSKLWHLLNLNPHPHPQNGSGEVLVNYDLHSVMIINVISSGSKPQLQVIPIRPKGRALITAVSILVAPSCTLYMSGYEFLKCLRPPRCTIFLYISFFILILIFFSCLFVCLFFGITLKVPRVQFHRILGPAVVWEFSPTSTYMPPVTRNQKQHPVRHAIANWCVMGTDLGTK